MEFKQIWDTFVTIPKDELPIEKKGNLGLDYLSWTHALHLAISSFPELTFNCDKEKVYDDGSMMVYASITIGEHVREMWLPVMDNKNNSIINPSSRQVSDNKMRCLVKCLSLFGLGLSVYAGEDLKYLDQESPAPKKKAAPKKKPKQTPAEDDTTDVVVQTLCSVLIAEQTVNGLVSTWAANFSGDGVDILALKKANSEHYANLVEHRNEKLKALLAPIESESTLSNSVNSAGKSLKAIKALDESEFEDICSLFTERKLSIKESQNGVD